MKLLALIVLILVLGLGGGLFYASSAEINIEQVEKSIVITAEKLSKN